MKTASKTWCATSNGLEGIAPYYNDNLMVLDELSQAKGEDLASAIYLLSNGYGKIRADKTGHTKSANQWRTIILSNGEISPEMHIKLSKLVVRGGQDVRLCCIPYNKEHLVNLHGFNDLESFNNHLTRIAMENYGFAGRLFLKAIVKEKNIKKLERLPDMIDKYVNKICVYKDNPEIMHVCRRFVLSGLAGKIASIFHILPESYNTMDYVKECLEGWLEDRAENSNRKDEDLIIKHVKGQIERFGHSRFQDLNNENKICHDRLGFINHPKLEIVFRRKGGSELGDMKKLSVANDTIYWYSKSNNFIINELYIPAPQEYIDTQFKYTEDGTGRRFMITVMRSPSPRPNLKYDYKGYKMPPNGWSVPLETMRKLDEENRLFFPDSKDKQIYKKIYLDEYKGLKLNNLWSDISTLKGNNFEILNYPTQKPEALLKRIIELASKPGSLVLDCFMGSGTTQAVAMKLGRRFIGADINMGAIQTTAKRLIGIIKEKKEESKTLIDGNPLYLNFQVYNVNNYDIFHNPVEAKDLLIQALEIEKLDNSDLFDGMKDGYKVKIMPVNRIATRKDLNPIISGMNYRDLDSKLEKNPTGVLDRIMLVCMGHEPDLAARLKLEIGSQYNIEVEVVDILREKERGLTFKYDAEVDIAIEGDELVIKSFYPRNLLQKLSLLDENVEDWRELVESVLIDWNYTGDVLRPVEIDNPGKKELVKGRYKLPPDYGDIRVKITDLLSESLERTIGLNDGNS